MRDVAPTATLTAHWMYLGLIAAIAGRRGSPFQLQFAFNFFLFCAAHKITLRLPRMEQELSIRIRTVGIATG